MRSLVVQADQAQQRQQPNRDDHSAQNIDRRPTRRWFITGNATWCTIGSLSEHV